MEERGGGGRKYLKKNVWWGVKGGGGRGGGGGKYLKKNVWWGGRGGGGGGGSPLPLINRGTMMVEWGYSEEE